MLNLKIPEGFRKHPSWDNSENIQLLYITA